MDEEKQQNITLEDVYDTFDSFLLLKDRDAIKLFLACVIGNQMVDRFPIWIMFVAPPSSGKTTILNSILDFSIHDSDGEPINMIHSISDLTTNSFASGMNRGEKETSLLHQMPSGSLMLFKDFTSILSKRTEERMIIMGQLREIYDGAYVKRTGNAENVDWQGKVGAIAGVTQAVYQNLQSMSVMGDRFMFYQIEQPNRKDMLRFKLEQEKDGRGEKEMMPMAREKVHGYLRKVFGQLQEIKLEMDNETQNEIIDVADFCTMVRSGIIVNEYTNKIQFVPEPEMPARMFDQMIGIASALSLMKKVDGKKPKSNNNMYLEKEDFKLIYKIAFDSIPIVRRIALYYLAHYKNGVDTTALATKINYPSEVVRGWLEQLNALGVVERVRKSSGENYWKLSSTFLPVMQKLDDVEVLNETLMESDNLAYEQIENAWSYGRSREAEEAQIKEMRDNNVFGSSGDDF